MAYSHDLRKKVMEAYLKKEGSIRELAERFKVSKDFVFDLIKLHKETGSIEKRPHGGGKTPTLDERGIENLKLLAKEFNDLTRNEYCDLYEERYGIKVSSSAMGRYLLKLSLTRKKTNKATEQNTEKAKKERERYFKEIEGVDSKDLFFLDECGTNTSMNRVYARSPKGKRAYGFRPASRTENITVIGALSLDGLRAGMSLKGPADGSAFLSFIKQILLPHLSEGKVVIMDNVRTHKIHGIEKAINSVGARLVYLPPYSPELNPIEECWSKFKSYLRKKAARIHSALENAISEAFQIVTPKDASGWFSHSGY